MASNPIEQGLDALAACLAGPVAPARAREAAAAALAGLLEQLYVRLRAQAPAGILRRLLDLEVAIGGETGDFRRFDRGQMVDLCVRGQVTAHLPGPAALACAVDPAAVERWLQEAGEGPHGVAALAFIHAWLRLLAEESGLVAPAGAREGGRGGGGEPATASDYLEPLTGLRMVWVPGGTFAMGDTFDEGAPDEQPVHEVTLSGFYLAATPVTQAQWCLLMPDNPSHRPGEQHPVEQVTLADVMTFLERLNAASAEGRRFDLPSEAQWEYAARSGGRRERYAGGQALDPLGWYQENATGSTAPVGRKQANGLGLFDMSGNVWEWCRDRYDPQAYGTHGAVDPVCDQGGSDRVIRGGAWHLDAWSARCSRRFCFDPQLYGPALGFRPIMRVAG